MNCIRKSRVWIVCVDEEEEEEEMDIGVRIVLKNEFLTWKIHLMLEKQS